MQEKRTGVWEAGVAWRCPRQDRAGQQILALLKRVERWGESDRQLLVDALPQTDRLALRRGLYELCANSTRSETERRSLVDGLAPLRLWAEPDQRLSLVPEELERHGSEG